LTPQLPTLTEYADEVTQLGLKLAHLANVGPVDSLRSYIAGREIQTAVR
jgi:hypothetical protein